MIHDIHELFERRLRRALRSRRADRSRGGWSRRDQHGIEALEIRRVFDYAISSILYDGQPVDGFSVFGSGSQFLTITTANGSTPFDSGNSFTVQFGGQGALHTTWVNNHTLNVALPALTAVPWNGPPNTTYANISITQSNVAATNTTNNSFIAYPANVVSITPPSWGVGEAQNLTLVAQNAARGFGNVSTPSYPYYLVGPNVTGSGGNVSGQLSATGNSTQLTLQIPPNWPAPVGNYTVQTTPTGSSPGSTDTYALIGNLSVAVQPINYTIASLTYNGTPITGWSFLGSGSENITLTLANGSTPLPASPLLFFGSTQALNVTRTSDLTLTVPVPSLGSYSGVPTYQNLALTAAGDANTTNGSFLYGNVALSNLSPTQVYLAAGGNLTLNASSAIYGFGSNATNVTVLFRDSNGNVSTSQAQPLNSTTLVVPVAALTGQTPAASYNVTIEAPTGLNASASNPLNLAVLPNPTITTLNITLLNSTGLSNTTNPAINDFYAYVYGNVGPVGQVLNGGWLSINATTGQVGTSPNGSADANHPFPGAALSSLTANFTQNATLGFNTSGMVYNGTRVYLTTAATLGSQPNAGFGTQYYDFIEGSWSGNQVFVDTSQVDQFGIPLTLNLSSNATPGSSTSGISSGLTRQDIIESYTSSFQNVPGYNLAVVPSGSAGSNSSPTYRVLAPNDLLNSLTAGAVQQSSNWTYSIVPGSGSIPGPAGNYTNWAWLNLSTTDGTSINGTLYGNGSPVTGPFLPAGTVIAEANTSHTATSWKIATYDNRSFTNQTINASTVSGYSDLNNVAIRIQQLDANMQSPGYQALMNTFGPSIYNGDGTNPWSNLTLLNSQNAIDLMFDRYKTDSWWQEDNQPNDVLKNNTTLYPGAVALYRGQVSNVAYTSIENTTENYAALVFTDYSSGSANPSLTFSILYPYFTTNSPANKTDPFNRPVPAPPLWYGQSQANFDPPSLNVFGGAGIFQPGGALNLAGLNGTSNGNNLAAFNDFGRDVAVALSRGYASTLLATSVPLNQTANLPAFTFTPGSNNTLGTWTMPAAVYQNLGGNVTTGMLVSSFRNFDSPMVVTGTPQTANGTTTIGVAAYVSNAAIGINLTTASRDNLQFLTLAQNGTLYPGGGGQIPYNRYESFIQSRGNFAQGVANNTGTYEKLNINGLGYGYAFSDYMGLSSSIFVNADTSPTAPQTQAVTLLVTMQPWYNPADTYDVQAVTFESQNISGWSLFGSGTDTVTITTTTGSTAFTPSQQYAVSFGGVVANGTAATANNLTVTVPALTSLWAGNGSSFANLTIGGANTTGNTTFAVLPVNLTGVSPSNGSVLGGTNLTLNASSKQYGFGNVANISVGFAIGGVAKPGLSVSGNATSLTLRSPSSTNLTAGNATLGVYATSGLTSQNLASNNLTFRYTAVPTSYDIQAVSFEGQNITGWSLFGSGTDNVTITTTESSYPFIPTDTYSVSFGGTNVTGVATSNTTLNVAVPGLVSAWAGNGTSFANLTIAGTSTTGNTSFAVLPVNLTSVTPSNGSAAGNTSLTLNASSKQYGFGNVANISVGFTLNGTAAAGLNVTGSGTSLTLRSPASANLATGNATLGVYATSGLTSQNLASNTLTYTYTAVPVVYDIATVAFEGQNITGWSLFGSGADNVTITTTGNSTAFVANGSYSVSFGGTNVTGVATNTNTLNVAVPSLVSAWAGNGTSFANLTIASANTTGNTSFAVLPVNLTSVNPSNGSVVGNTALTLNASSKQFGFGNVTNISVGFTLNGTVKPGLNVTGNATSLTLRSPSSPNLASGNATLGVYATSGLTSQNLASNTLTYTYTPVAVSYVIQSVSFEGQNITGWSLFGSGADNVTITTTNASSAFVATDAYTVAFGNATATATAVSTNSLSVRVPALVSQWVGSGTSSFANLSITGGTTTGNTSFGVLPVNLTSVSPNNGSVAGNTTLNLTASSKQFGFGNATNLSAGLSIFGATTAASNVTVINSTTLSLTTPAVGEPGNWTIGIYKAAGLTTANLASNNLPFTYTERSLAFVSGDFNADNLTDVATLLDDGSWQVSFTQSAGNATLVALNATNSWTTAVRWRDWSVLRSGDRDVVVARAEATGVGSWWKLSYDGAAAGTSAANFSTNFVGSWASTNGTQWLNVVNGDFDGDGSADIAGRNSTNGQWWMLANATQNANASNFLAKNVLLGAWNNGVQWDAVLAGNFKGNANGQDQIVGLTGNSWWISEYAGSNTLNSSVMTSAWSREPNYTDYLAGNFGGTGRDLIAAKTESNAWYSVGYNATLSAANNTPSLMGTFPSPAGAVYTNVLTGDFRGTANATTGIAALQRSGGNLSWYVLQRPSASGNYTATNFGSWPQSSVAQAFAGYLSASDQSSGRTGVLTRTRQGASMAWQRGVSNGTAFASSSVNGYPS